MLVFESASKRRKNSQERLDQGRISDFEQDRRGRSLKEIEDLEIIKLQKLNTALLTAALVLGGLLGISIPQAQAAAAFNTFPISFVQETNRDFPMIDARNATAGGALSSSQPDHDNGVQASPGDEIEFVIYYHNSDVFENEATNVLIRANLPGGSRSDHEVSASIDSDQTALLTSADSARGGNIVVHLGAGAQTLEFLSGSVRHFPNRSATGQTVSQGESLLGSGLNIGSVRGCFEFSGFVSFRARVGTTTSALERGLAITKRVMNITRGENIFRDTTLANPGDRLRFEIRAETLGNASQTNLIIRDLLPSRLNFISGSMRLDGISLADEFELFGSGRNLGTLSAAVVRVVTFETNLAAGSQFSGATTLVNTANVRSDQVSTRQDDADILVQLVSGIQFTLRKTAFNLTQGVEATSVAANPGDLIIYTLYYRNSGGGTISGAVIEDNIHDVLELAAITNQGGAVAVNSLIRFSPLEVLPGVEIAKTFQVRVRDASLFPASSDLVMVNTYGNEVRVVVRRPQVAAVRAQPPRTGASEWLTVSLAAVLTLGFIIYDKKLKSRKARAKIAIEN